MTILEGGNSPNQGHTDCKWREDLIWMLEEFGQSYRVLAIAYNQLKSKTSNGTFHSGCLSSSTTSKTICAICNKRATGNSEDRSRDPKSIVEGSDLNFDCTNADFELLNKQKGEYHELLSADTCSMKFKPELECRDTQIEDRMADFSTNGNDSMKIDDLEQNLEDPSIIDFKCDNTWLALKHQITKLTEDNLSQFTELARRNDEKRETIRRLQLEVAALKRENKGLQISLRSSNADSEWDQPRISKSGGRTMGKLFKGCSP